MSPMNLLMVFGAVICGWTMLSVLSGERHRRVRQIEAEATPAEPETIPTTPPPVATQAKKPGGKTPPVAAKTK